jgi:hypothetical protein
MNKTAVIASTEYKGFLIKETLGTIGATKKAKKVFTVEISGKKEIFSAKFFAIAAIDANAEKVDA